MAGFLAKLVKVVALALLTFIGEVDDRAQVVNVHYDPRVVVVVTPDFLYTFAPSCRTVRAVFDVFVARRLEAVEVVELAGLFGVDTELLFGKAGVRLRRHVRDVGNQAGRLIAKKNALEYAWHAEFIRVHVGYVQCAPRRKAGNIVFFQNKHRVVFDLL